MKIFKSFNPELKDSDLESIFWLIFQQLLIESDGDLRDHETFKEAAGLLELFLTEKKYQRMFIERIYTVVGF